MAAGKLIWGADLYKGFKLDPSQVNRLGGSLNDLSPWQMLNLEDKTIDWIKAVADYFEIAGWNNVERRMYKIQRNYWMRHGQLNPSEYIINPGVNEFSRAIGMLVVPENQSPLQQFYHLAPNFVDVLRGEFIKRDNTWTIEAVDPQSKAQAFAFKEEQFQQVIMQMAMLEKQKSLEQMGLTPETDPEQYQQQLAAAQQQLAEVEFKSRTFKTTGVQWAEKVLKIHERRYNLHEIEPDGFETGLITDMEFYHLDLMDDDFKLELLNPMYCDYFKKPGEKYVSQGDYFLWFDWMSTGDIVNHYGRKMKEEDILRLKEVYIRTANLLIPDSEKVKQGAYYDLTKNWLEATDLNPERNDALLGHELANTYMRGPNFDHNLDVDIFGPVPFGKTATGHPQLFRVMRLYWRSMKRIGWLTKINRDGTRPQPDWVDENYKVTVEPQYDTSAVKEKTKDNLIYGEHIDWEWTTEWRHVIKINANHRHTFWQTSKDDYEPIYIDGGPVKFQFRGRENPFDGLPPVEGCHFSYLNTEPHSFIDRVRPMQVLYNICMNQVPKKFLYDRGNKIAIDTRILTTNNLSNKAGQKIDPLEAYEDMLQDSEILPYKLSREALEGLGQPALPTVLQLSTIQEAQLYFTLAQAIKAEAGELVGISRQRLANIKPSDTATAVNQGIVYSETQTEKYFEQHSNLMQRVRQRMLDATQYYTTFQESSREMYQNEMEENIFLQIEGMDNLLPHYNINLQSKANVRAALEKIQRFLEAENTLPIKASDKIQALVENSLPKIFSLVKEGEDELEKREQEKQDSEMKMRQQEIEAENMRQQQKIENDNAQKEMDRQSQEKIAEIRALGGIQTDNNKDSIPDAQQNLDNFFRGQEISDARNNKQDEIAAKRQTDADKMMVEREKAQMGIEKEKIKQDGALKVAKENKTNAELKRKK